MDLHGWMFICAIAIYIRDFKICCLVYALDFNPCLGFPNFSDQASQNYKVNNSRAPL